jgi:hypothetical protein
MSPNGEYAGAGNGRTRGRRKQQIKPYRKFLNTQRPLQGVERFGAFLLFVVRKTSEAGDEECQRVADWYH